MKNRLFLWPAGVLSAGLVLASFSTQAQTAPERVSKPIPGQYLVVFKRDVRDPQAVAEGVAKAAGGQVMVSYKHALKGAAIFVPNAKAEEALIKALSNNPNVVSFEQDATVHINTTQSDATWGIDRIDQRGLPLDKKYSYTSTGAGVYAFIIDTGIRATHAEFAGRVHPGAYFDAFGDNNKANDCNGHGTHVAGTVAGTTFGVAKQATLVPVRVLDCAGSGSNTGVIAGIDWAAGQLTLRPAVANLSLGGGKSSAINTAVAGAVSKGLTMVVAAGNSNRDACNYSPASEPSAITVGATASTDARASYSNFGSCLDIFAPGSSITSSWFSGDTALSTISGTSMASPHVAGLAVRILEASPGSTPAQVAQALVASATAGKVTSAGSKSPNLLAYAAASTDTGGGGGEVGSVDVAIASISRGSSKTGKNWRAVATVTLTANAPQGASITGNFSGAGSTSCSVSAGLNSCSLSYSFPSSVTQTTFTVTGVSGSGLTYNGTGTLSVIIYRP
jgi:subtilisin family serine protease